MSGVQLIDGTTERMMVSNGGDDAVEPTSLRDRLAAAGFIPRPICVISSVDHGTRYAEVFEEESRAPGRLPRFLVRLIVSGECEHVLTLADLPELLRHFDRLTSPSAHAMEDSESAAGREP